MKKFMSKWFLINLISLKVKFNIFIAKNKLMRSIIARRKRFIASKIITFFTFKLEKKSYKCIYYDNIFLSA